LTVPMPTLNVTESLATPVTVTMTGPVAAPTGTLVAMEVSLQLAGEAATPLNVRVLAPCADPNPNPLIVTVLPAGPAAGDNRLIVGLASEKLTVAVWFAETIVPVLAAAK